MSDEETPVSLVEEKKTLWETLSGTLQDNILFAGRFTPYTQILPQHVPIFLLRVQGYTQTEIAELVGLSRFTVSQILRSLAGQKLITALYLEMGRENAESVMETIRDAAPAAVDTLIDTMQNGKDEVRVKSALAILDRAGYGVVQKSENTVKVEIDATQATLLNLALRETMDVGEGSFEILPVPTDE